MKISMIASECAPVAKVGGLADVVIGLTNDSNRRGNEVEVILPKYDCIRYDLIIDLTTVYDDLMVPWHKGSVRCTVWSGIGRWRAT